MRKTWPSRSARRHGSRFWIAPALLNGLRGCVAVRIGSMMTLISSLPNMVVVNILSAKGLLPFGFFSVTPFGLSVLAAGMLLGRGLLSKQPTVEVAKTQAPRAHDLLGAYGLTPWWHRLRVPADSPLIGRSAVELRSLYDRFGVIPVGLEKHAKGQTKFLPAIPETIFETDDAILVIVAEEQAPQLIQTQQLIELPRLDERQAIPRPSPHPTKVGYCAGVVFGIRPTVLRSGDSAMVFNPEPCKQTRTDPWTCTSDRRPWLARKQLDTERSRKELVYNAPPLRRARSLVRHDAASGGDQVIALRRWEEERGPCTQYSRTTLRSSSSTSPIASMITLRC